MICTSNSRLEALKSVASQAKGAYEKEDSRSVHLRRGGVQGSHPGQRGDADSSRVCDIVREPFQGREVVLDAFDLLREKNATIEKGFESQRDELRSVGALGWDSQYPPRALGSMEKFDCDDSGVNLVAFIGWFWGKWWYVTQFIEYEPDPELSGLYNILICDDDENINPRERLDSIFLRCEQQIFLDNELSAEDLAYQIREWPNLDEARNLMQG